MSVVVGLDPSLTEAGIAIIHDPATAPSPNVPKLAHVGESGAESTTLVARAARIRRQRDRILRKIPTGTRLVLIEAIPPKQPEFSKYYVERGALCLELAEYLGKKGIPVVDVGISTIKLFATGDGKAKKPAVIKAMTELWPGAPIAGNDNRSDALAIATIGAMHLGWYQPEATHHWAPKIDWGNVK